MPHTSLSTSRLPRLSAVALAVATLALVACGDDDAPTKATAELALLSTTDLHANVRSFDYFKLAEDKTFGFERTATLIRQARSEFDNHLLVDNGDTIQGNALADYEAAEGRLPCNQQLAMFKAMNVLKFDAGTLGNHEFNYGLPFLNQVLGGGLNVDGVDSSLRCAEPGYPVALANVTSLKSGQPLVEPYLLLERTLTATREDGQTVELPIKIGVVGLTTPGIMSWDKRHLDGKVSVTGGLEAAQRYVPEVRAKGADLVFVLLHGGMVPEGSYNPDSENPGWHIAKDVPGIDGLVMGHQHQSFPLNTSTPPYQGEGVDNSKGTLHGVPAVMPSSWGKALGVIAYELQWDGQKWQIESDKTRVQLRETAYKDATGSTQYVPADAEVANAVQTQHQAAIDYVKTPIGSTDFRMSTLFADVGDPAAIQIVNQAQQAYVADYIQANLPQYRNLPVLSISAPFKAGYQSGSDYTDVAAGPLAIYNAADLYLYPNTLHAVKVNGTQIKLWLENAALRFNQIDPTASGDQWLINDSRTGLVPEGESAFAGYNFDVFTTPDIHYEIDVTQPKGQRIRNLSYEGQAITASQEFIVATNNYRAESSAPYILGTGQQFDIILASPDANRDVLIEYIRNEKTITRAAHGSARSWRFTQTPTAGKVLLRSAKDALPVAQAAGLQNIHLEGNDPQDANRAIYRIDLSQ